MTSRSIRSSAGVCTVAGLISLARSPGVSQSGCAARRARRRSSISPLSLASSSSFATFSFKSGEFGAGLVEGSVEDIDREHPFQLRRGVQTAELRDLRCDLQQAVGGGVPGRGVAEVPAGFGVFYELPGLGDEVVRPAELGVDLLGEVLQLDELLFAVDLDGGVLPGDGLGEGAVEVLRCLVRAAVAELGVDVLVADLLPPVLHQLRAAFGDLGLRAEIVRTGQRFTSSRQDRAAQ